MRLIFTALPLAEAAVAPRKYISHTFPGRLFLWLTPSLTVIPLWLLAALLLLARLASTVKLPENITTEADFNSSYKLLTFQSSWVR